MGKKLLALATGTSILLLPASVAAQSYTVQPGDTLSGIADSNKTSLRQVERANTNIQNYNLIFPGQLITIPDSRAAAVPALTAVSRPATTNSYMTYIFSRESDNNPYAINVVSGACGLGQSFPCSKLLSSCGSLANVRCQVDYFTNDMQARYSSWQAAYDHEVAYGWW